MSRKGKVPIQIPKDVKAKVEADSVSIEGPKGKLDVKIPHGIKVELVDNLIKVNRVSNIKQYRANHGTVHALITNMITGVTKGHKRELEIQGIGFRAAMQGKKVVLNIGFSHQVEYEAPAEIKISVANQTSITVEGINNLIVGQEAAKIRGLKPVEPYKGKGIRYVGENVRRKQGKSVTK